MGYVRRLDHVGVNVEDLEAAKAFFIGLGLEVEGAQSVEGDWVGDIIGLRNVHTDLVMLRTPDGSGALELVKFHTPVDDRGPEASPANRLGIRHITFAVDDLNTLVGELRAKGFDTIGAVHNYEDIYRLCYVRGPEGIIVELAEDRRSAPAG